MFHFKKMIALALLFALTSMGAQKLEAVTYVTDTGGYAYDESRAVTNLAPAIALATIAIAGIIAIAVQNSHGGSSSSTHYGYNSHSCSSYYYYSSSSSHCY